MQTVQGYPQFAGEEAEAVDRFVHGIAHMIDAFGVEKALARAAEIVLVLRSADPAELVGSRDDDA